MKRLFFLLSLAILAGVTLAGCGGGQQPPTAKILRPQPNETFAEPTVQLEGQALDNSNQVVTRDIEYEWDVNGDGIVDARGQRTSYRFTQGGNYQISLTVKTAAQAKDARARIENKQKQTVSITVRLNQNPTITQIMASPESGKAPLEVSFSAEASDPEGQPLTFEWDFGDRSARSSEAAPRHTYPESGTYEVLLKVSDGAGGSAELRKTITVMGDFVEIKMITDQADPLKNYFEPKEVTVKAGTKIRFINVFGPHTATAYRDKIPPGATPFNSGDTVITTVYQPGTACTPANGCYEVVLTVPGTYEYMCIPHEALGMVGKIIVEP